MEPSKTPQKAETAKSLPEEKILKPHLSEEQKNIRNFVSTYNKWLVIANSYKTKEKIIVERALFMDLCYYFGVVVDYILTSKKINPKEKEKFIKYKDILNNLAESRIKVKEKIQIVKKIYSEIYNMITSQGLLGLQDYGTYKRILKTYVNILEKRASKSVENSPKQEMIRILNFKKRSENVSKTMENIDRILRKIEDFIMNWGSVHIVSLLFYTIMADSFVSKFDTEGGIRNRIEKCNELIKNLNKSDNPDEEVLNAILVFYDYITQAYTKLTTTYSVNVIS